MNYLKSDEMFISSCELMNLSSCINVFGRTIQLKISHRLASSDIGEL